MRNYFYDIRLLDPRLLLETRLVLEEIRVYMYLWDDDTPVNHQESTRSSAKAPSENVVAPTTLQL